MTLCLNAYCLASKHFLNAYFIGSGQLKEIKKNNRERKEERNKGELK
jgi:hypothetical protein